MHRAYTLDSDALILVTFLIAVSKFITGSNFRERGFILAYLLRIWSVMVEKVQNQEGCGSGGMRLPVPSRWIIMQRKRWTGNVLGHDLQGLPPSD